MLTNALGMGYEGLTVHVAVYLDQAVLPGYAIR